MTAAKACHTPECGAPTKKAGTFSLFGFGGISAQAFDTETDPQKWESEEDRYGGKYKANTGVSGLTHTIQLGKKTSLRSSIAYSYQDFGYDEKFVASPDSVIN